MRRGTLLLNTMIFTLLSFCYEPTFGVIPLMPPFLFDASQDTAILDPSDQVTTPPIPECYINVKLTKKIAGRCMSFGMTGRKGCVSETMLHPFHPDC